MRRTLVPLAAVALPLASLPSAVAATADPCAAVARCHVVARVDVDGNGTREPVGIVRRSTGELTGTVTVRVGVGSRVLTATRSTENWAGPVWQGATDVDGRRGRELFVGRVLGAHTVFYSALTVQGGRLVERRAPGGTYRGLWVVDSSFSSIIGWWRRAGDAPGVVRLKEASRNVPPHETTYDARVRTFRWTPDGWVRTAVRRLPRATQEQVGDWGGFHLPGLPRW